MGLRLKKVEETLRSERDEQSPMKRTMIRMAESSAQDAHATREAPRSSRERNLSPQGEERTARVIQRSAEVSEAENQPSGIYHL